MFQYCNPCVCTKCFLHPRSRFFRADARNFSGFLPEPCGSMRPKGAATVAGLGEPLVTGDVNSFQGG